MDLHPNCQREDHKLQMMLMIMMKMIIISKLASSYSSVAFVNLSVGFFGIFVSSSQSFIEICSELSFDKNHFNFLRTKLSP